MATWPTNVWTPTPEVLDAIVSPAEWAEVVGEVAAYSTYLGTNPHGSDATVAARLARLDAALAALSVTGWSDLYVEETGNATVRAAGKDFSVEGVLVASFDETVDVTIAATTGTNGRCAFTTEAANQWLYLWLGVRPSPFDVVAMLSVANTRAGLGVPAGLSAYTKWRRIPTAVRNDAGSNFVRGVQDGATKHYRLAAGTLATANPAGPLVLQNGAATTKTSISCTNLVPPTARRAIVQPFLRVPDTIANNTQVTFWLWSGDSSTGDQIPVAKYRQVSQTGGVTSEVVGVPFEIDLGQYQTLSYRVTDANARVDLAVLGYTDAVKL